MKIKPITLIRSLSILIGLLSPFYATSSLAADFKSPLNAQVRFDDRSGKDSRTQYRLRWFPQYTFSDERWNLHAFLSTGDDFSGSHNTMSSSHTDNFYLRRLFLRYESQSLRTEFGVIPTYKGKVSSSGLSKNGFIKGLRVVSNSIKDADLELVIGSLNDTRAKHASSLPQKIDYMELELSKKISDTTGYEISVERMTGATFLRTEYRFTPIDSTELFVEWIKRIDNLDDKLVLGFDSGFTIADKPVEFQGYYAYVSAGLGQRAELTEDFISTGHGVSLELKTPLLSSDKWKIFTRFDGYKNNNRFMIGAEFKI